MAFPTRWGPRSISHIHHALPRIKSFLGTLLPGGELDQEFVLLQGGLSESDAHLDGPLRSLIAATCEAAGSADFGVVLGLGMDRGTEVLVRALREDVYEGGGEDYNEETGSGLERASVRLAAVLPAVARWAHVAVHGMPNELIEVRVYSIYLRVFRFPLEADGVVLMAGAE